MSRQTLRWTALPAGEVDGRLRLHVVVSVRLESDAGVLGEFPDFLDWPARRRQLEVLFDGQSVGLAEEIGHSRRPDVDLWRPLFPPDLPVRTTARPPLAGRTIVSYPVGDVVDLIQDVYRQWAPRDDHIPRTELLDAQQALGQLVIPARDEHDRPREGEVIGRAAWVEAGLDLARGDGSAVVATPGSAAVARLLAFAAPRTPAQVVDGIPRPLPPPEPPDLDFHARLSALGSHPALLGRFGLLLEVVVGTDGRDVPSEGLVQVVPTWDSSAADAGVESVDVTPATSYSRAGRRFASRHADGTPHTGLVDLSSGHRLVTVDADGAAIKLVNMVGELFRAQSAGSIDTPTRAALPTLRSAGMALVREARAESFRERLARTDSIEAEVDAAGTPGLEADDIVRGLRIDVADVTGEARGHWRSLCDRVGRFAVGENPQTHELPPDEGWVSSSVTESSEPGEQSADLYLHEALATWDGWGLCIPEPGASIDVGRETPEAAALGLKVAFAPAPGRLPRLRYGHTYRVRARTVDLAGHGLSLDEADADAGPEHVTEPAFFGRFEPIPPPVLAPRHPLSRGESVDHLVVRTGDRSAERHVLPPATSFLTIERHGAFDGLTRDALVAAFRTAESLEGSLWTNGGPPLDGRRGQEGGAVGQKARLNEAIVHDVDQLELPYLPDPMAGGAVFRIERGNPAKGMFGEASDETRVLDVPFKVGWTWSDASPFRLVVLPLDQEGMGSVDPGLDPQGELNPERQVTLRLPPAAVCTLRLGCRFGDLDHLRQFGIWDWLATGGGDPSALQEGAAAGALWALTPWREITLVHAVEQPLADPVLELAPIDRKSAGATSAPISGVVEVDVKSTCHVDLEARWLEYRDVGDTPGRTEASAPIGRVDVPSPDKVYGDERRPLGLDDLGLKLELGDTRHRRVWCRAVATTRFREYFDAERDIPGRFTRTWTEPENAHSVRSSARPAAPVVREVVPSFEWERTYDPGRYEGIRRGGGLRVYLERPWWSSGEGELLGVVCESKASESPEAAAAVTRWGRDPIWGGPGLPAPGAHHIAGVARADNLVVPENPNVTVDVTGHEVSWEPREGGGIWSSDLLINLDADGTEPYFPFVKLALARYQPASLPGMELSPIVHTDFCQIVPTRTLSVHWDPTVGPRRSDEVQVHLRPAAPTPQTTVEAWLQRRDRHRPDGEGPDELDWEDASDPVVLEASSASAWAWHGTCHLPLDDPHRAYRVVVREYETWSLIQDRVAPVRRLVYADAVELTTTESARPGRRGRL